MTSERKAFARLLARFEQAVRMDEIKGMKQPSDVPAIEYELFKARRLIKQHVGNLIIDLNAKPK